MINEIEYQEIIEKTIPSSALENFINDLKETYRNEYGWVISEPKIKIVNSEQIKIIIQITKYKNLEMNSSKSR